MLRIFLISLLFLPQISWAQEPGRLDNKVNSDKNSSSSRVLIDLFASARGLSTYEIMSLHNQRIGCERRMYSPAGWVLDGDADLKVTQIIPGVFEIEFPTHLYLGDHNPFKNGVNLLQTTSVRRLMNLNQSIDGEAFKLSKKVNVSYVDPDQQTEDVSAVDEIRAIDNTYPQTYVIRTSVYSKKPFTFYMICN